MYLNLIFLPPCSSESQWVKAEASWSAPGQRAPRSPLTFIRHSLLLCRRGILKDVADVFQADGTYFGSMRLFEDNLSEVG